MKNKILAIGPVTKDLIITPHDKYYQIGGAVYYQTMTLTQLKKNVISIISVGRDDVEKLNDTLKKQKLILKEKTQEYTNIYDEHLNRKQKAKLPKNPINITDINIKLDGINYALLSPLSPWDIPPETIGYLKEKGITTVLVAQGYLRNLDKDNNITERKWTDRNKYLKYVDIICLDEKEALLAFEINSINEEIIKKIITEHNLKQVIITLAEKGSKIFTKEKTYAIPAIKTEKIVDATGLGDTYIASYIAKLEETKNIYESGLFASISAKEKLANKGSLKTKKEKIEEELNQYR